MERGYDGAQTINKTILGGYWFMESLLLNLHVVDLGSFFVSYPAMQVVSGKRITDESNSLLPCQYPHFMREDESKCFGM